MYIFIMLPQVSIKSVISYIVDYDMSDIIRY